MVHAATELNKPALLYTYDVCLRRLFVSRCTLQSVKRDNSVLDKLVVRVVGLELRFVVLTGRFTYGVLGFPRPKC